MTDPIPIGALACSAIGARSVFPAILESDRFVLEYIASRDPARAKECAAEFACRPATYEELIAADDISAVYVSLPVGLHHRWGKAVVSSGKHLLMEKTFTHDYESAREVVLLARQNGIVAMEALAYVYHPLFETVMRQLRSEAIGRIRAIQAQFGFPELPASDIRNQAALAGGALTDCFIYPLSFALQVAGAPPTSLHGHIVSSEEQGVDARGSVQLDWSGVCSAQLAYGFGMDYWNSCTVWGELGRLTVERIFTRPPHLPGQVVVHRQGAEERIEVDAADHFVRMLAAFSDRIEGRSSGLLNEGEDVLQRMRIIDHFRAAFARQAGGGAEA